jgi:hypothetical protein
MNAPNYPGDLDLFLKVVFERVAKLIAVNLDMEPEPIGRELLSLLARSNLM